MQFITSSQKAHPPNESSNYTHSIPSQVVFWECRLQGSLHERRSKRLDRLGREQIRLVQVPERPIRA